MLLSDTICFCPFLFNACLSVKDGEFMGVLMGAQLVGLYEYILGIIILRLFRIYTYLC